MRAFFGVAVVLLVGCGGGSLRIPAARAGCERLEPGSCGAAEPLPAAACYVRCSTDSECSAQEQCVTRNYNPCVGNQAVCDACGGEVRVCLLRASCENLVPGCGSDPLPSAGCYVRCTSDSDCSVGNRCQTRSVDPCAGSNCEACGAQVQVCVPAT